MNTAPCGAAPTPQKTEKNQNNPVNVLDVLSKEPYASIPASSSETSLSTPPATATTVKRDLPPLSLKEREKLYDRLRNNVPEPLQKEHRWILLYDTGNRIKMPIGGHPSATMNLEQAIAAHREYKNRGNNALAIGYSTGGKMSYGGKRVIPPDPHCIWLDYDDLKDADLKTIAAPEIIEEIEKLREYGAYVEISMSGKGMHVCIPKPRYYDEYCKGVSHKSNQPEVFGNGQYVAVTGRIYGDKLPDWTSFSANPYASVIVRNIITRAQAWKKGIAPDIYDTEEGADARVIAEWQKLDPKPTGADAAMKIAELVASVDFSCENQYLCPETIRRLWMPIAGASDAEGDAGVTAAYEAAAAWQEQRRAELKTRREEERRQVEARLADEFHVSAENVPTITFDGTDADWDGKITAVNYINNYCRQNIPLKNINDPSKTAYRICAMVSEYLAKHDPDHCNPDCINAVFMACKLFPYLYGPDGMHRKKYPDGDDDGWNPRKAGMCIANIFGKHEKEKQDIQKQIAAQIRADEAEMAAEKQAWTDHAAEQKHVYPTLGDVARYIASICSHFIGTFEDKDEHLLDEEGNPLKKTKTYFNPAQYRREWHWATYSVAISDAQHGFAWYDGVAWNIDPNGVGIRGAIDQAAELIAENVCDKWAEARSTLVKPVSRNAAVEDVRTLCISKLKPQAIAALRHEASVSTTEGYGKGLTCTDGVIIIDADGIHTTAHDPDRDVWFGSVPVATTDLLPNLAKMTTLEEVVSHFPNFKASLDACGPDKVRLMASMAGVAVYYTMPNLRALECWDNLWDNGLGGSGKTTHMKLLLKFLGSYATSTSWDIFTGKNCQNGSWFGKVCIVCHETKLSSIDDTENFKTFTSGGWTLKWMYSDPISIDQPLLMISTGNCKPMFTKPANAGPIWDRMQPCEFTVKFRDSGKEFPCSDDEYIRALFNVGCWVAYKLMRAGKAVSKKDLPYYVPPDEVEVLSERVPVMELLHDIGKCEPHVRSPLNAVYDSLVAYALDQGYDLKGAPELRNMTALRNALEGVGMQKYSALGYSMGKTTLKVVEAKGDKKKESRYWLNNFKLDEKYISPEEETDTTATERPNTIPPQQQQEVEQPAETVDAPEPPQEETTRKYPPPLMPAEGVDDDAWDGAV